MVKAWCFCKFVRKMIFATANVAINSVGCDAITGFYGADKSGPCICIQMVNMITGLQLSSYSIPGVEILKTIISIPLNRGYDI